MGAYRYLLAILVLLSHAGISFFGYNPGVVAVMSFFLLSGYVMTQLIAKYYWRAAAVPDFYLDRAARLFPQFLLYMLLTLCAVSILHIDSPFLVRMTPFKWLLNFLMLPQGFFMYWADGALTMPQTWSLGLELTFYLVIPWILLYAPGRRLLVIAALSFAVFAAAYWGLINTDNFGYRLLPGTLYVFLAGSAFARDDDSARLLLACVFAAGVGLFILLICNARLYALPFNKEAVLGLTLGMLIVGGLRRLRLPPWAARLDLFLGDLSYGVFLNHFLLIWLFQRLAGVSVFNGPSLGAVILASSLLALLSFLLVEQPALRWRRAFRRDGKTLSA